MKLAKQLSAFAGALALAMTTPAVLAGESSYTEGSVWEFSQIKVEPGQFENYMDFLAGQWKRLQEFSKKEGVLVSYHVLAVNNARQGEPDLILALEFKDYYSIAQRREFQKKMETYLAADARKMEGESGERKVMRKILGGMELQELKLK
ncbi:hypothetical protein [Chitinimonas naiadis]